MKKRKFRLSDCKSAVRMEATVDFLRDRYTKAGLDGNILVRDMGGLPVVTKLSGCHYGRQAGSASGAPTVASLPADQRAEQAAATQRAIAGVADADKVALAEDMVRAWIANGNLGLPLGDESIRVLCEARGMPWRPEYIGRTVPYFGSDERVDSMGDIVRQSWIFDLFEKNSPMPFSHDWGQPPVGKVIFWEVMKRNDEDYKGKALFLLGLFATADDWEWADTVFRLVNARLLVSGSVGFRPDIVIDVKDDKERAKLGLGRYGLVFEDNHLLEYSPTTIPANAGATIPRLLQASVKDLQPYDVHVLRELQRERIYGTKGDRAEWMKTETMILSVARALWPEERYEVHKDLDVPVTLENHAMKNQKKGGSGLFKAPPPPAPAAGAPAPAAPPEKDPITTLNEIHAMISQDVRENAAFRQQVISMLTDLGAEEEEEEPNPDDESAETPPPAPKPPAPKSAEGLATVFERILDGKPKT